jgi:uncharacterized MAPEG superfamily protein
VGGLDGEGCRAFHDTALALLAASVVFGFAHIILVSHLQSWQRGYRWTASSREQSVPPLVGIAGRAERALRNYLETFPFFAAAILIVTVTNTHDWLTLWGAHFYFLGSRRLRNPVSGGLTLSSVARVEHPNHWDTDEHCWSAREVTALQCQGRLSDSELTWPAPARHGSSAPARVSDKPLAAATRRDRVGRDGR